MSSATIPSPNWIWTSPSECAVIVQDPCPLICYPESFNKTRIIVFRPQPLASAGQRQTVDPSSLLGNKNRFQFLQQTLDSDQGPLRGSGQSGDDYSYQPQQGGVNGQLFGAPYGGVGAGVGAGAGAGNDYYGSGNGYNYQAPKTPLVTPSRQYLPVA